MNQTSITKKGLKSDVVSINSIIGENPINEFVKSLADISSQLTFMELNRQQRQFSEGIKSLESAIGEPIKKIIAEVNNTKEMMGQIMPYIKNDNLHDEDYGYYLSPQISMDQINSEKLDIILDKFEEPGILEKEGGDQKKEFPLAEDFNPALLEIKFFDGHTVKIRYEKGKRETFDYKEMGFMNEKTQNPDIGWRFLREIADNGGYLTNRNFNIKFNKQTKYTTQRKLQNFFRTRKKLFEDYTRTNGYRPLFQLKSDK